MIAVIAAIVVLALAGVPLVRAIDPTLSRGATLGAGFMAGCGLVSLAMLAISAAGMRWSFFLVLLVLVATVIAAEAVRRRQAAAAREPLAWSRGATVVDAATAVSLGGYALFATLARPWEWDFWAIWGLRARTDFVARGIDVAFLTNPDVAYSHPDYPPLVPFVYGFTALARGEWDDRWLGLVFVALAAALLVVARDEIRRATGSEMISSVATLALAGVACSPFVGLADGALAAFGTAGLLALARGVREDDRRALVLAGVLLGLGAMTKNEGLALAASATIALAIFRWRRLAWLVVPLLPLAAPWLLFRATHALATDVVSGGVVSRIARRLADPAAFLAALAKGTPDRTGFWIVLAILLVAGGREVVRRHGVMLVAVLAQVLCYVVVYAGTMHDLASHVQTSMGRISGHVAPAVGVICALAIRDLFLRDAAQAEEKETEHE
jgi:hypothetical protein